MGILGTLGWLIFIVGWIWLVFVAYKTTGALWAVLIFFFHLIAGLIFCIIHKTGWMQLGLMVIGCLIMIAGGGMAMFSAFSAAP